MDDLSPGCADELGALLPTLTCTDTLPAGAGPDRPTHSRTTEANPTVAHPVSLQNLEGKPAISTSVSCSSVTDSKLAGPDVQSVSAESGSDVGSISIQAMEPAQGRRQKQAAAGISSTAGRGKGNGHGLGGAVGGNSRHGIQLPSAERLYAWCREVRVVWSLTAYLVCCFAYLGWREHSTCSGLPYYRCCFVSTSLLDLI